MTAPIDTAPIWSAAVVEGGAAAPPIGILDELEAGRIRAAEPDPGSPDGWRVRPEVKTAILACFADRTTIDWSVGPLTFPRPGGSSASWRPGGRPVADRPRRQRRPARGVPG